MGNLWATTSSTVPDTDTATQKQTFTEIAKQNKHVLRLLNKTMQLLKSVTVL